MFEFRNRILQSVGVAVLAAGVCACASTSGEPQSSGEPTELMSPKDLVAEQPQWTAYGFIRPGVEDPEIIGLYVDRKDCDAAVANWMSRQVVGNPVSGECLPIDRR